VIAFTVWSSFAHAALMGTQACRNMIARGELIGVAVLVIIRALLIALAPSKQLLESASHPGHSIHIDGSLPNGRSSRSPDRNVLLLGSWAIEKCSEDGRQRQTPQPSAIRHFRITGALANFRGVTHYR